MENQNNHPQQPQNEDWLDEILGTQGETKELGPDEQAIAAVGLTHPDDLEIERIVQETMAEDFETKPLTENAPVQETEQTQFFAPPEDNEPEDPEEPPEPAEEETDPEDDQPLRKRRPRMKKGYGLFGIPHILATAVWLAIMMAIGVSLGRVLWVCAADVLAFGKTPQMVTITVLETDDLESISEKLQKAGLVRYPGLFKLFAEVTGKGEKITPGTFVFNEAMKNEGESAGITYDYNALVNRLVDYGPSQSTVKVTFPEGANCAQIFELLEEKGVCTVEALEEYAANGELGDYWFLEDVERGHKYCLEGYLAPDTYEFYTNEEDISVVLGKLLNEFDDRFTDRLKQKFMELNQTLSDKMAANGYGSDFIAQNQMTLHDVVVMASIIEKESANNAESYDIAAVFYNRLTNQREFPWLNSDATMVYAEKYYYKDELLTEEDRANCEFNTYVYKGLIPKPIANPSLNSLAAALDPRFDEDAVYYYFVYDKEAGVHRFSETEAEHLKWIEELGLSDDE